MVASGNIKCNLILQQIVVEQPIWHEYNRRVTAVSVYGAAKLILF